MTDKEGILRRQASGRWAICRPDREPFELTSGDVFRLEVPGFKGLIVTRLELRHKHYSGEVLELPGYYSIDDYPLRDGQRAAIGAKD